MVTKADIDRWAKEQGLPKQGLLDYLSRTDELLIANLMMLRELTAVLSGQAPSAPGQPPSIAIAAPKLGIRTEAIISGYNARSTETINPSKLANCISAVRVVVVIRNSLNQDVSYSIIGNTSDSYASAFTIATATCTTLTSAIYQFLFEDWMPYVGALITPSVGPSAGSIDVFVIVQEWGTG